MRLVLASLSWSASKELTWTNEIFGSSSLCTETAVRDVTRAQLQPSNAVRLQWGSLAPPVEHLPCTQLFQRGTESPWHRHSQTQASFAFAAAQGPAWKQPPPSRGCSLRGFSEVSAIQVCLGEIRCLHMQMIWGGSNFSLVCWGTLTPSLQFNIKSNGRQLVLCLLGHRGKLHGTDPADHRGELINPPCHRLGCPLEGCTRNKLSLGSASTQLLRFLRASRCGTRTRRSPSLSSNIGRPWPTPDMFSTSNDCTCGMIKMPNLILNDACLCICGTDTQGRIFHLLFPARNVSVLCYRF